MIDDLNALISRFESILSQTQMDASPEQEQMLNKISNQ